MKLWKAATISWLRIVLFLLMTLLPFLCWCAGMGDFPEESVENRKLAERPAFELSDMSSFPQAYENYFNDHLPLRSRMVSLNSMWNIRMTKTSSNSSVIIGENDWLFYHNERDGDPIGQYTGRLAWDQEKLEAVAQHVVEIRDQLAERGIEFVLFFAPNKERMYHQYMPGLYGKPRETYPLRQLTDYLHGQTDVRIINSEDVLQQAIDNHPEDTYYYKYDTHWNALGAYIGSRVLLREIGIDICA